MFLPRKSWPLLALVVLGQGANAAVFADFQVGSFNPSLSPAYLALSKTENVTLGALGSFQTTISTTGSSWGLNPGPQPPTGVAVNPSWVDPAFSGDLTNLTVLAFLGGIGNTVNITLNFSTLNGGVLPAGSVIAFNDVDGLEQTSLTGPSGWYSLSSGSFYQAGVNVGSPWGSGQPSPAPGDVPSTAGSTATDLILTGPPANTDGVTNFIVTRVDLTSLTITARDTDGTSFAQALAIGLVPEPSAACLLGLAGIIAVSRRTRHRAPDAKKAP